MLFCAFITALLVQNVRSLLYAGVTGIRVGVIGVVKNQARARLSSAMSVLFGLNATASDPDGAERR